MAVRDNKPSASDKWQEHEHSTPALESQAQRLLIEAGSPELAKHAVDSAAKTQPLSAGTQFAHPQAESKPAKDQFARELGFTSYLSLFEASTPVRAVAGKQWFITTPRTDLWLVWNDQDLRNVGRYPTREDAERAIPPATEADVPGEADTA